MGSLKDALLKAGFKEEKKKAPEKKTVHRPKEKQDTRPTPPPKAKAVALPQKMHSHQMHRNFCEACNRTLPDVEFYRHKNPTLNAQWICVQCADNYQIPDKFRETEQSDHSRQKIFRREYGPTLRPMSKPAPTKAPENQKKEGQKPFANNKNFKKNY